MKINEVEKKYVFVLKNPSLDIHFKGEKISIA